MSTQSTMPPSARERDDLDATLAPSFTDPTIGNDTDHSRWSYLEKNVDNVMWKLEDGLDMKTVRSAPQYIRVILAN